LVDQIKKKKLSAGIKLENKTEVFVLRLCKNLGDGFVENLCFFASELRNGKDRRMKDRREVGVCFEVDDFL
jgi:hypothetical protein